MASSASGQDEPNRPLWLATRAGKMEPSCPLGTTRCIPHEKFPRKPYNKSFIDQVCSVKMAGYWPRSFFASLWTSTSSRSINMQKKNLANIQPYWPHTWSITHTYYLIINIRSILWSNFMFSFVHSCFSFHASCCIHSGLCFVFLIRFTCLRFWVLGSPHLSRMRCTRTKMLMTSSW